MLNLKTSKNGRRTRREIEKRKKIISDYLKIAPKIGIDEATIQKQTDLMLEDLSKLMKKRK